MNAKHIIAGLLVAAVGGLRPSLSCSCVENDASGAELLRQYEAVFVGEPVVVRLVDHAGAKTDRGYVVWHEVDVKFRVWRAWKGVTSRFITVRTGSGGGDCGYDFHLGDNYVVFASKADDGKLRTDSCTRTVVESGQGKLIYSLGSAGALFEHRPGEEF